MIKIRCSDCGRDLKVSTESSMNEPIIFVEPCPVCLSVTAIEAEDKTEQNFLKILREFIAKYEGAAVEDNH